VPYVQQQLLQRALPGALRRCSQHPHACTGLVAKVPNLVQPSSLSEQWALSTPWYQKQQGIGRVS
jgi:hypothetical protein